MLPAGAAFGHMETYTIETTVIDSYEHADLTATLKDGRSHIDAPHDIRRLGGNGAAMVPGASRAPFSGRGLEVVLPQQAPYLLLASTDPLVSKPCPDLAVALISERAVSQDIAYGGYKLLVRKGAVGPRCRGPAFACHRFCQA